MDVIVGIARCHMDMKVKYRLSGDATIVRKNIEPFEPQRLNQAACDDLSGEQDVVEELFGESKKVNTVDLRDDQGMAMVDRANVEQSDRAIILEENFCRSFLPYDFAESAVRGVVGRAVFSHKIRER